MKRKSIELIEPIITMNSNTFSLSYEYMYMYYIIKSKEVHVIEANRCYRLSTE